jgi:hypothetical protein
VQHVLLADVEPLLVLVVREVGDARAQQERGDAADDDPLVWYIK